MRNYLSEMLDALTSAYTRKDRNTSKFKRPTETNIGKLFSVLAWGLDSVQAQAETVKLWDNIDLARGSVLDRYGANFGVNRLGADDEFYRLLIKVKMLSQLSGGDIETVANAAATLLEIPAEKITLRELFPAKVCLDVKEADLSAETLEMIVDIAAMIKRILAAGVELIPTLQSYIGTKGNVVVQSGLFELSQIEFTLPDARRTFSSETQVRNAAVLHDNLLVEPPNPKRQVFSRSCFTAFVVVEHTRMTIKPAY